ncbi:MAG: hypothetical protein ACE5FF_17060 [Saprospiraceae bacterium]
MKACPDFTGAQAANFILDKADFAPMLLHRNIGGHYPTTNNQQPTTDNQQPTTNN